MTQESFLSRLKELTAQVALREGCRLYDLEFVGGGNGRGRVLRIYVDRADGPVSVDDCANVSRGLNLLLDVEDAIPGGAYVLEVSSPGLERPLKEPWHFNEALGKQITVKINEPIENFNPELQRFRGAKSFKGELLRIENGEAIMRHEGEELKFPLQSVERARMIFNYAAETNKHPKKKR